MPARHLVIGLDGADVDLLDRIGEARTPGIAALRRSGAWARVRTPLPHATLPSWTTFLTGMDPGAHGVFDFTTRHGTKVSFTAGTVREAPTVAARLDRMGLSCACLFFPGTWPPERLEHGVFVSGWDSPVAFEADRSFVWPPPLWDELRAQGPLRFDEADEMAAERVGWHASLADRLEAKIETRLALASHLLASRHWDFFAVYFGESDTAAHHLVSLFDERSPRRPAHVTDRERDGLPRVYAALDRAVRVLHERAGGDAVELTLVSDHGSGPSSDVVVHLNRVLEDHGLLTHTPRSVVGEVIGAIRGPLVAALPPRARDRLFRAAGRVLPGWLESRARFGAIDLARTRAFSEELNYFPSIVLNLRGREPHGTVGPDEIDAIRARIDRALATLRDPDTGTPIVRAVHTREALYAGPHVSRAPDLVLELELRADGTTYNVAPSRGPGPAFTRLEARDHLGRKGRSLPGSHRARGLFVAAGPSVPACGEIDAHLVDVTATLLARMGVEPPPEMPGRVLRELRLRARTRVPLADAPVPRATGDTSRTEARLRALGYVE